MAHAHLVERVNGTLVSFGADVKTADEVDAVIARLRELDPTFEVETGTTYSNEPCNAKARTLRGSLVCSGAGFIA